MATSGTTTFNLDLVELVEEAFERAGRELRSGYDLKTARRSLNIMFADWANRGINLWTIEQGSIPLYMGTITYDLPVDTIDLLDQVIRTGGNSASTQADLNISRISVSTYATIPNKLQQARPIQVWIQRLSGEVSPTSLTLDGAITAKGLLPELQDLLHSRWGLGFPEDAVLSEWRQRAQRALLLTRLPELPQQFPNPSLTVHVTFEYQR